MDPEATSHYNRLLQERLETLTDALTCKTAAEVHRATLRIDQGCWRQIRTNQTCLTCLRRKPEYTLTCGHTICETCVHIFAQESSSSKSRYELKACLLCSEGVLDVKLKPSTAGYSVLSIDGGGVRGIIPLEFLSVISRMFGPSCQIQDLFDMTVGTSSGKSAVGGTPSRLNSRAGGLIVMSLFLQGWTVAQALAMFQELSRTCFHPPQLEQPSFANRIRYHWKCLRADGYYDVAPLERCLKEVFGPSKKMFDSQVATAGSKVAVTASSISDASTFIFSNFNGTATRRDGMAECMHQGAAKGTRLQAHSARKARGRAIYMASVSSRPASEGAATD